MHIHNVCPKFTTVHVCMYMYVYVVCVIIYMNACTLYMYVHIRLSIVSPWIIERRKGIGNARGRSSKAGCGGCDVICNLNIHELVSARVWRSRPAGFYSCLSDPPVRFSPPNPSNDGGET